MNEYDNYTQADWDNLSGWEWCELLRDHPQFADRCQWENMDGFEWFKLLVQQPQFADRCPWEKMDGFDWTELYNDQPQLRKFIKANKDKYLMMREIS